MPSSRHELPGITHQRLSRRVARRGDALTHSDHINFANSSIPLISELINFAFARGGGGGGGEGVSFILVSVFLHHNPS